MKLDKQQALKILDDFQHQLEEQAWYQLIKPQLKASLLYGSVAKGTNRPDSDIDVLLIVPLQAEEDYTVGEYFYKFRAVEINIVLRSIEKLRLLAKAKSDPFQQNVFKDSVLIYQADDEVKNLLKQIAAGA
ncbi:MAG TPA: nucleotidyltransferase domain-containing protein [Candidatus Binatia bacterium]|nr:nucleotidyltransferase domain-containing protein [Candidatus Binatia bacterium]